MARAGDEELVCIGAIAGAHGVTGAVKIKPFTERPEDVAAYGPVCDEAGNRRFEVSIVGQAKGALIAHLSGVGDRGRAEALKGVRLYVPRSVLPPADEGEYYHADLIGLSVRTTAGEPVGAVVAVHNFGAGDLLEIRTGDGQPLLLPFTKAEVPAVDLSAGEVIVSAASGHLDAGDPSGED